MANAAALPPLPSVRAKELESRSSTISHRHTPTDIDDRNTDVNDESDQCGQIHMNEKRCKSLDDSHSQSNAESLAVAAEKRHRERLEQIEALHQKERKVFNQLPPLDPTVTCDAIHQYLSSTSQFLNSYIADANASLEGTNHKLSVLEKQMSLLESKLESIPGLFPEESSLEDLSTELKEENED